MVYLDTSHFDILSRVMENRPNAFLEFISAWKQNQFVLALTKVHVEEIMALSHAESRDVRFALLEHFIPFQYESENFFEREVLIELSRKGLVLPTDGEVSLRSKFFVDGVKSREQLLEIKAAHSVLRPIHVLMNKAHRVSWQAAGQAKPSKGKQPRTTDLSGRIFGKLFYWFTGLFGLNEPSWSSRGLSLSRFMQDFSFRLKVKFAIRSKLGVKVLDNTSSKTALDTLSITDCKGLWLRQEVEEKLKRANDFDVSNERDLDHVQYYPYVDLFLTDKRIINKLGQVTANHKDLVWLTELQPPLHTRDTLESLTGALFTE